MRFEIAHLSQSLSLILNLYKTMTYDIFSKQPQEPKVGRGTEFLKFLTSKASAKMQQPLKPMAFPALSAHIHDVEMKYSDGKLYEIGPGQLGHLIGVSGIGKRELSHLVSVLCHDFYEHDQDDFQRLAQWVSQMKSRAANRAKPERPSDIYFLYPPEDITKPAFAQNAQALEQNGGLTQYLNLSECEAASRIAGSKSQMSILIRNAFDVERGSGQLRCSESGISANPIIRLCMSISSTPEVAQAFYKRDMRNGFFSRINIVYVPRGERVGKIPKQKEYDEEYNTKMDLYLQRLKNARGCFHVKQLNHVAEEMGVLADITDSDELFEISHRSIFLAWKKAAVLWLLNDMTYTRSIGEWMIYFCYYDLWSRLQVFDQMISPNNGQLEDTRKRGQVNMLESLPNPFSEQQLENLRISLGKSKEGTKHQISVWTNRNFVTYSNQTGLYTKTEEYLDGSGLRVQG